MRYKVILFADDPDAKTKKQMDEMGIEYLTMVQDVAGKFALILFGAVMVLLIERLI